MQTLKNIWGSIPPILKLFVSAMLVIFFVWTPIQVGRQNQASKKMVATANSLRTHLIGTGDYRTFEVGLEEYTISALTNGYEIEVRDRRICHGSTSKDDACSAIIWKIDPRGKFISREQYYFQNGRKVWLGRVDSIGNAHNHWKVESYGSGNALPYVFQTYRDDPKSRSIYFFQEHINNILKEVPPAA